MIAHYLINQICDTIWILSETYLKYSPKSIEDLIGVQKQKSMRDVALEEIKEYAEDADVTFN
jgi:DNA polymerase-1